MNYRASKIRSSNVAFVLTPDLLKRLAVILGEVSKQLEFTVKFADGVSVDYANVEEIIDQPNSERRSIVGLIAGTTGDETSANVVLKSKFASEQKLPIEYTLNGPQRSVIYLADQLDDWVAATSQWYSRLLSPTYMVPIGIGAFFLPLYVTSRVTDFLTAKGFPSWAGLIALGLMVLAEYFFFKLFPRGTFAIGRGAARHQFLKGFQVVVLIGLAVSIVGGVIANMLTKH
jgi:hypothetical protein